MKWQIIILVQILLLFSCTATKTTVILDSSKSYLTGGDGQGYFTAWIWKRNGIIVSKKPIDTVSGIGKIFEFTITDNLGNSKSQTITVK